MWNLAHPSGPPLESVVYHVAKDFAPGIEAGRRRILPRARPFNDFFHLMGKETEMTSRCKVLDQTRAGKCFKANWDYVEHALHTFHHIETADMVNILWPAFLRKLCLKSEVPLAVYLFQYYTKLETVGSMQDMRIFCNSRDTEESVMFLTWWAGSGIFPGFNSGSSTSEALHSPWEKKLRLSGRNFEIDDALEHMQTLYTDTWKDQYAWESEVPLGNFPLGDDPALLNGSFLAQLNRSSAFDYWTKQKSEPITRMVHIGSHVIIAFPRTVDLPLLSQADAALAAQILLSTGEILTQWLVNAGILRACVDDEVTALQKNVAIEKEAAATRNPYKLQLESFLRAVGLCSGDDKTVQPEERYTLSLKRYNDFFSRTVYALRKRPDGNDDGWPYLRCTCLPASVHSGCEHLLVARSMSIPDMQDSSVTADVVPPQNSRGRPAGSFTTVRGQKAAERAEKPK